MPKTLLEGRLDRVLTLSPQFLEAVSELDLAAKQHGGIPIDLLSKTLQVRKALGGVLHGIFTVQTTLPREAEE